MEGGEKKRKTSKIRRENLDTKLKWTQEREMTISQSNRNKENQRDLAYEWGQARPTPLAITYGLKVKESWGSSSLQKQEDAMNV